MPRSLAFQCRYDISPYRLFRSRNRLDYLHERSRALGQQDFAVLELRQRDDRFRCVTRMQIETDLPVWARRLFRPRNMITLYELWHDPQPDETRIFDISATVDGVPVAIGGRGMVIPRGPAGAPNGCDCQIDLMVSATVAFSASRLEDLVAGELERIVAGERRFAQSWFASAPLIGR